MNPQIIKPNGSVHEVKNLGWLLRNWQQIKSLHWQSLPQTPRMTPDGLFSATMRDGSVYMTDYASFEVWKGFINRPVFRGLPVTVDGITGTI